VHEASCSEEPGAGKLHAGICEGGAGQPASLPRQESLVTEIVLKKLAGEADPDVVALLQQSGPAADKHVSDEARATLAGLLQPQNNDSPEVKELRGILHGWVWRTLATTAS
jgi:hypothetical protein